jgi:SRSO17 transposase
MTQRGPIEAWIIDDTAFPKKGTHSVGVHHQSAAGMGRRSGKSRSASALESATQLLV